MDTMETEDFNQMEQPRRRMHRLSYSEKGRFFVLRNILNIIFIIGAIVGMLIYFFKDETVGGLVLLTCVAVKIFECILRMIR